MRLASQADVREQLGLGNLPDYIAYTNAAIEQATLLLENDLRTPFDQAAITDAYAITPVESLVKLRTSRGFLQAPPSVLYAVNATEFARGNSLDISAICAFDLERGVVWVKGTMDGYWGLRGAYLTVAYTAGFAASVADPLLYDPAAVPSWLVQLCQLRARLNMAAHPALEVAGVTVDSKTLLAAYNSIVAKKTRYLPGCIPPSMRG